jgi:hypothetical protein
MREKAMKIGFIAVVGAATVVASADAGFLGFVASARNVGANTVIDIFAGVSNASDKFLNVYDLTSNGVYVQKAGLATKTWKPDAAGFTSTRNTSDDSFMTAGTFSGGAYGGEYFASTNTNGDPNFTGTSWNATPASAAATTIPALAGWYTGDPTSVDNNAESLAGLVGRVNAGGTASSANFGIWVAHLVLAGNNKMIGVDFTFGASASIKDGVTGQTTQGGSSFSVGTGDYDLDGVVDFADNCPTTPNPNQANADGDSRGDACDNCPTISNSDQQNSDGDSLGNACDPDDDNDGVLDGADNCQTTANASQLNTDGDSQGDACDADDDNDGRADTQDNCPLVPNPGQADCDGDGIGDACKNFVDCNGNGVLDNCDILSGTSNDLEADGIPDECQADCDKNGIPDLSQILAGILPDCNGDQIPDTCQGAALVDLTSGNLGAPSGAEPRAFTFASLLDAESAVEVTIDVRGDMNGASEWIDVSLNGGAPRRFLDAGGNDCPSTPDRASFTITRAEFLALTGSTGELTVTVTCPPTVDATECKGSGSTDISVSYVGISAKGGDCNGNRRLDVCEVVDGTSPDCNGNKVPDSCDIGRGASGDCNANGVPDECEIAASPAIDCNSNGVIDTCDITAGGLTVDCDANGRLDECEIVEIPGIDCNDNQRPDACDIIDRVSSDIDVNGQPDECQTVFVPGDYATIQAAINAAPADSMRIVKLGAGSYAGPVSFNGKPIVLRGAGATETTVTGTGGQSVSVIRFTGGEPAVSAVEAVTVTGGTTGTQPAGTNFFLGGGIFGTDSAASIRNCIVRNNAAGFGGGIYLLRCTGGVSGTEIRNNNASTDGGGIQLSQGSVTMTSVTVEGNQCNSRGGGMHVVQGQHLFQSVTVRQNSSQNLVGGLSWYALGSPEAELVMEFCSVTGNTALVTQGGIGITDAAVLIPTITIAGSTVCDNLPRPNISGRWIDNGGNDVCDCPADLNLDGTVNGADLSLVLSSWGPCTGACLYDVNADGIINGSDLSKVLSAWGTCGN